MDAIIGAGILTGLWLLAAVEHIYWERRIKRARQAAKSRASHNTYRASTGLWFDPPPVPAMEKIVNGNVMCWDERDGCEFCGHLRTKAGRCNYCGRSSNNVRRT